MINKIIELALIALSGLGKLAAPQRKRDAAQRVEDAISQELKEIERKRRSDA
jgi:hypothetical protein